MKNSNTYSFDLLTRNGYITIPDTTLSDEKYCRLYWLYDRIFCDKTDTDECVKFINESAIEWLSDANNTYNYSFAPVGFSDRLQRLDKDNKKYFQFNDEFGSFLKSKTEFNYFDELREFVDILCCIHNTSQYVFYNSLKMLNAHIDISRLFNDFNKLHMLIKLLRYYPSQSDATGIHYDKSALTLVHHGSDMHDDTFKICCDTNSMDIKGMLTPTRYVSDKRIKGTGILFPGLLFNLAGISKIRASPHCVTRSIGDGEYRHSTIVFLMIPGISTSGIPTKVAVKRDGVKNEMGS